ncbi:DUF5455 family protein [Marinospirillum sp. MEB164]|uniref:DUF5455 family protein n=1 Tax=Marinospirillum alkalitolerans TaxID=3123374 RepID=A0ABW8PX83_9GAMM
MFAILNLVFRAFLISFGVVFRLIMKPFVMIFLAVSPFIRDFLYLFIRDMAGKKYTFLVYSILLGIWMTIFVGTIMSIMALSVAIHVSLPSELARGIGLIKPHNAEAVLSSVITAEVMAFVLREQRFSILTFINGGSLKTASAHVPSSRR